MSIRTAAACCLTILIAAIFTLSTAACGSVTKPNSPPGKLHEEAAGFSVDPPDGWEIGLSHSIVTHVEVSVDLPDGWEIGEKPKKGLRGASAPAGTPSYSNLVISEEQHTGTTAEYATKTIAVLQKFFEGTTVVKNEAFTSDSGVTGTKFVVAMDVIGQKLRQSWYVFPKTGSVIACTFNTQQEGGEAMDAVFDKSMKTFRLEG